MPHTSAPWMTLIHTSAHSVQYRRILVSASKHQMCQRLADCLADLGMDYQLVDPRRLETSGQAGTLFVLDCGVLQRLNRCPARTIVVFTGCVCPLSVLHLVVAGRAVPLRYEGLDAIKMCRAIIRCVATNGTAGLAAHLVSLRVFAAVPRPVIGAFVLHPERPTGLADLCRVLGVSPASGREIVHLAGFRRAEHLFAALRCRSWQWFAHHGFERSVFEDYLGITDRSHFRRGCQRAGLMAPWQADGDDMVVSGPQMNVRA